MKKFRFIYLFLLLIFAGVTGYSQDFNPNLIKGLQAVENGNYADGLKYFKQGALEGDKYSCGRLAALYFYGLGTDTNYDEAKKWAQKGYELGNSYAAAIAGLCKLYEKGMETPEGRKVAQPYLIYAYQADDAEFDNEELYANAGLLIAYAELDKGNEKEALKWVERTINDFPTFAPTLGQAAMIYWGLNDYEKAVKYAFIADKENNLFGTLVLGLCLADGTGIAKDEVAGFNKIKKVATIGTPEIAMYYLGNCYYYGIGTPVNKTLAKEWYQKAANAGVPEAQEMLENFTESSASHSSTIHSVDSVSSGPVNSIDYSYSNFSDYGKTPAEIGEMGKQAFNQGNYDKAKEYWIKAGNKKDPDSCGFLALCYTYGMFDEGQDLEKAMQWALTGYYNSMPEPEPVSTGMMGVIGTTVAKNKKEWLDNLDHLEYAYNNGFASSHIGNLISVSYLLKGDSKKAEEWARKIMNLEELEDAKDDYYMASAILGKILMDRKDYMDATIVVRDAATEGGNPLAQYVMGRSQIKMNIFPEVGQQRVEDAALYKYLPAVDIKVFDDEIQKYYNSIKNKNY